MKNLAFLFSAFLLTLFLGACGGEGGGDSSSDLTTEMDSMSYAIGASFGKGAKESGMNLNGDLMAKGYTDCKAGTSYINEENAAMEMRRLQMAYMQASTSGNEGDLDLDSLSYAAGSDYFIRLNELGLGLNHAALAKGIKDNFTAEATTLLSDQQSEVLLQRFNDIASKAQAEKNAATAAENKAKGKAFLEEKAQEEGVLSTPSGLLYKVIEAGSGKSPVATDKVSVHYEGTLIDGTVFDSSIKRGKPAEFPRNGVIKGWTEGLQLMKTGAKYQFYIPSELAYGDQGSGSGSIGPGETLIFDVELLEIL
jgi:FKBP-type peptidyl-prolyl cis-trans isomerase